LPGCPDIVFPGARLAIFCDGDFWHGRDWPIRRIKLKRGHNAAYWIPKIEGNIQRDLRNTALLESEGWCVVRYWESEIKGDLGLVVANILKLLGKTEQEEI